MTAVTISLGSASEPVTVTLPALVPLGTDGLVLSRSLGSDPTDAQGRGWATVTCLSRRSLVRAALDLVRVCPEVGPVAVWPAGVPAEWTALALVVGGIVSGDRPVGSVPPVVCAVCPPTRKSRPSVRHAVRADLGGRATELTVWELLAATPAAGVVDRPRPAAVAA
ncbi:hypothetical protein I6A84_19450 [Frankia sp. CNm7]|uniref:Uncharacterized protein n=1 Tax=Frankia nepalensis TaxID=1836974 RepID=A0A937RHE3_9ACTN|nr:hypothetical protein [Frankia nepalensis]MBL7502296.1 hypothetical protein [Frankia nepalensis]MBL7514037.1 hypothetical protein [Frankia nepalensis]MBL7520206.1 hypothetical protein [Frankia nepalensis]MBL7626423.1 hypothetical protein [Frankia nepalensis]